MIRKKCACWYIFATNYIVLCYPDPLYLSCINDFVYIPVCKSINSTEQYLTATINQGWYHFTKWHGEPYKQRWMQKSRRGPMAASKCDSEELRARSPVFLRPLARLSLNIPHLPEWLPQSKTAENHSQVSKDVIYLAFLSEWRKKEHQNLLQGCGNDAAVFTTSKLKFDDDNAASYTCSENDMEVKIIAISKTAKNDKI